MNLPGISVWGRVSSRGVVGPFSEGTVTGAANLSVFQESIAPVWR